jgi:hypothetical protein
MKFRSAAAALVTAAVTGSLCLAAPATAALETAAPSAPATAGDVTAQGAEFLVGQLTDGTHYVSSYTDKSGTHKFDDQGLTADGVFALLAAGGNAAAVNDIVGWLKTQVNAYTDIDNTDHFGPYSGSLAKLALVAEATGGDPHNFGADNTNKDLLAALRSQVCTSAKVDGNACTAAGDFYQAYSAISQALGVLALQSSPVAADHLTTSSPEVVRLHQLQCSDGGFSSTLITAKQACKSDVDTTAYAVQALAPISGTTAWLSAAMTYLEKAQQPNGLFANPAAGTGANANSTGLAAQALQALIATLPADDTSSAAAKTARQRAVDALLATNRVDGGWPASLGGTKADVRATTQALPAVVATEAGPSTAPATAGGDTCSTGTLVAVDFGKWSGPLLRACYTGPAVSGSELLDAEKFTVTEVTRSPGVVCRLGNRGFSTGTQYPTDQSCVNTPPATAYWAYWIADAGSDTWTYSDHGFHADAAEDLSKPGQVQLWTFGATNVGGTSGTPTITPSQVRAGTGAEKVVDVSDSADASKQTSNDTPWGLIIGLIAAVVVIGAAAATAWRRRRMG